MGLSRMRTSITRHVVIVVLCFLSISANAQVTFVPPNAESSNLLKYVFNKKWSNRNAACDLNGGFFRVFTKDSLTGEFTTVNGKPITRSTKNIITEFKLLSENSFSHTVTMYREGPDSAGNIVRANVLYQTHTYTLISKTQMDYTGTHTRINDLETQKQGRPVFKIEPENGFRTLCP